MGWAVVILGGVWLAAMVVWDWTQKPNAVILPPRGDDTHD